MSKSLSQGRYLLILQWFLSKPSNSYLLKTFTAVCMIILHSVTFLGSYNVAVHILTYRYYIRTRNNIRLYLNTYCAKPAAHLLCKTAKVILNSTLPDGKHK